MAIHFACSCGRILKARDENAGRIIRCSNCGADVLIPADETPIPGGQTDRADSRHFDQGEPRTSGKAIASLICGIGSFLLPLLASIPAIILGILGLREVGRSNGQVQGRGLAIGGIATGIASMVCVSLVALLVVAYQRVGDTAARSTSINNLSAIG